MKLIIKKLFVLLFMTAIIASSLPLFVNASNAQKDLDYEIGENHYTVKFDDGFSEEQQEYIAKRLLGLEDGSVNSYGLMCTLFGHKYEENKVEVITHKVRASAPRCLSEFYNVQVCSRCDDMVTALSAQTYISCCPVG